MSSSPKASTPGPLSRTFKRAICECCLGYSRSLTNGLRTESILMSNWAIVESVDRLIRQSFVRLTPFSDFKEQSLSGEVGGATNL